MNNGNQPVHDLIDPAVHNVSHLRIVQSGKYLSSIVQVPVIGHGFPYQRRGGSVFLVAATERFPVHAVLRMDHNTAELSRRAGTSRIDSLIQDNGAADSGPVGNTEKILKVSSRSKLAFPDGCRVDVILYSDRHMKLALHDLPHLHPRITGYVFIGVADIAIRRIHLAGSADPDGLKVIVLTENLHSPLHHIPSAVPGIGGMLLHPHNVLSVPDSRLDGGAPDIQCRNPHNNLLLIEKGQRN